ncbi:MAG: hypothetical protein ACFFD5_04795 [Candidatus Thorarchaeota archaeon]
MNNKKKIIRDLPISLQGIETVLVYLNEKNKQTSSIRSISDNTNLSMRVVKNILLQLEKFNQVERVVEGNNILPKWRITKFGKRVIKEAKGIENEIIFQTREDELLDGISIDENVDKLKLDLGNSQDSIVSNLNTLQIEISKILGSVLNLNNPIFEDLMGFIIKRIKFLKQKVSTSNLASDILSPIKKIENKQKKISKEETKLLLAEILFFNSVILNEIKRITEFDVKLSTFIENSAISNAFSVANDLREEIRILSTLIYQRESINIDNHIFSSEDLKKLIKNKISTDLLEKIIDVPIKREKVNQGIEDIILKLLNQLKKGESQLSDHNYEIRDSIPLFELYQLILDEKPELSFNIEELDNIINSLADEGYIPGIKIIQNEDTYLKVVQLKAHDITEDEISLVSIAIKSGKFTLADIVEETGWTPEKSINLLNKLSRLGILKYSKSFLHGEQWYIITENK